MGFTPFQPTTRPPHSALIVSVAIPWVFQFLERASRWSLQNLQSKLEEKKLVWLSLSSYPCVLDLDLPSSIHFPLGPSSGSTSAQPSLGVGTTTTTVPSQEKKSQDQRKKPRSATGPRASCSSFCSFPPPTSAEEMKPSFSIHSISFFFSVGAPVFTGKGKFGSTSPPPREYPTPCLGGLTGLVWGQKKDRVVHLKRLLRQRALSEESSHPIGTLLEPKL